MNAFKLRYPVILLAIIFLAACTTLPPQTETNSAASLANAGAFPENYKEIALEYIQTDFFDPYSVRSAKISTPRIGPSWVLGDSSGWIVCIRANAKNRMGAYTGLTDTVLLIRNGTTRSATSGEVPYYCNEAAYQPFSEANDIE